MPSVLRGIFWNAHNVLCMSGAVRVMGIRRTIHMNGCAHIVSFMWGLLRFAPFMCNFPVVTMRACKMIKISNACCNGIASIVCMYHNLI